MKIQKVKQVKTPTRGTIGSAGLDFYVPSDFKPTFIAPGKSLNIPSGIKADIPEGYALVAFNKSGVALKGLQVGACVVDEDYHGEIHLHVNNITTNEFYEVQPDQKLVQFLLLPITYCEIEVVEELQLKESERGEGGFGSTGLN